MVYATRGLLRALLEYAADQDPQSVTVSLAVTRAGALEDTTLKPDTSVFTHFYLPDAGASVTAVFGVDLATPPGTNGRFISHPSGAATISREDDLAEVVIIAVPPWDESSLEAFDRAGRRLRLDLLDIDPPAESLG